MMRYDANSSVSIKRLRDDLLRSPPSSHVAIATGILAMDLMRPQWSIRVAVRVMRWRLQIGAWDAWHTLLKRYPGVALETIENTAKWVIEGRDTTSVKSAGGLNQSEVDILAYLISAPQS